MAINHKLEFLRKWAEQQEAKTAFIDPAAMGMPPGGGAPPMDPAAMGGAPPMDPAMMGAAPPMDPAMMGAQPGGGAPPMDPAMMGAAPPMDPSMQMMADQEMMRTLIQEEIQKAMGGGEGGQGIAAPKKGNKVEESMMAMEKRLTDAMKEQQKLIVAILRQAGIEIPLADIMGIDGSMSSGQQQASSGEPGVSETLFPGGSSTNEGSALAKVGQFEAEEWEVLTKAAELRSSLTRSVLGTKLTPFDPRLPEKTALAGLYR